LTAACDDFKDEVLITSLLTKAYCAEEQRIVKQGSRDFFSLSMNHPIPTRTMLDKHSIILLTALVQATMLQCRNALAHLQEL
jgi:hypothetical protein